MLLVPVVDGRQTYGAAQVRYKYKPLIGRAVPRQTARGREQSLDRQRVLCMCVCVHCLYVYVFMYVHTCRHACMHYICSSSGLKYIVGFNIVPDLRRCSQGTTSSHWRLSSRGNPSTLATISDFECSDITIGGPRVLAAHLHAQRVGVRQS